MTTEIGNTNIAQISNNDNSSDDKANILEDAPSPNQFEKSEKKLSESVKSDVLCQSNDTVTHESNSNNIVTPKKHQNTVNPNFKTPEKLSCLESKTIDNNSIKINKENTLCESSSTDATTNCNATKNQLFKNENKTPEKPQQTVSILRCEDTEPNPVLEIDVDNEMISEVEQAKLLIAAKENFLKAIEKTPIKQRSPNSPRQLKNSPGTPGRGKRVELVTLASPKTKKIKLM